MIAIDFTRPRTIVPKFCPNFLSARDNNKPGKFERIIPYWIYNHFLLQSVHEVVRLLIIKPSKNHDIFHLFNSLLSLILKVIEEPADICYSVYEK